MKRLAAICSPLPLRPLLTFLLVMLGFWKRQIVGSEHPQGVPLLNLDLYIHHVPMTSYGFDALRTGALPLWNPYQLCGVPFLATPQTGLFYPGNLLYLWPDTALATEFSLVAHLAFAAFCMWLLARLLGLGTAGAIAAALTFTWSGWVVFYTSQAPLLSGMCWLPAMLLCIESTLQGKRYAPFGLALAVAFQLLNGSIEFFLYNGYVAALFSVFRLASQIRAVGWRPAAARGALLIGCVFAGVCLALPQLLPTLELLGESVRAPGSLTLTDARVGFPGKPLAPFLRTALHTGGVLAVGFLPVMGLALGPGSRGFAGLWWFSLTLAVLGALLASGGPLFELYFRTPMGSLFRRPEKLLHIYAFGQSLLAALALDRLAAWRAINLGGWELWTRPAWVACFVLVAGCLIVLAVHGESNPYLAASLGMLCLFGLSRDRRLRGVLVAALLVLQAAGLFFAANHPNPRPAAARRTFDLYADLLADLKRQVGSDRVYLSSSFFVDISLTPKQGTLRHLRVSTDYEPLASRRYAEYFARASGVPPGFTFGRYALGTGTRWGLMDLTATRYYVVRRSEPIDNLLDAALRAPGEPEFERVHETPWLRVYARSRAFPRARFVPSARVLERPEEVLMALDSPGFDPAQVVLVEGGAGAALGQGTRAEGLGGRSRAQIQVDEPERVVVDVSTEQPGFLVLADAFHPGWKASVNGREIPIQRANYLFRAVPVEAGQTRVSFEFLPASVSVGFAVSAATGALLLIALFARLRNSRF